MGERSDRQAPVIITLFFDNQSYQIRAALRPDYASVDYDLSGPTPPARWQAEAGPIFLTEFRGLNVTGFHDGPAAALAEGFADLLLSFDIEPKMQIEQLTHGYPGPPASGISHAMIAGAGGVVDFPYWFMRVGGHGSWHRVPAGDTVSHCGIPRKKGDHIDSDATSNAMKRICAVCLTASNR